MIFTAGMRPLTNSVSASARQGIMQRQVFDTIDALLAYRSRVRRSFLLLLDDRRHAGKCAYRIRHHDGQSHLAQSQCRYVASEESVAVVDADENRTHYNRKHDCATHDCRPASDAKPLRDDFYRWAQLDSGTKAGADAIRAVGKMKTQHACAHPGAAGYERGGASEISARTANLCSGGFPHSAPDRVGDPYRPRR